MIMCVSASTQCFLVRCLLMVLVAGNRIVAVWGPDIPGLAPDGIVFAGVGHGRVNVLATGMTCGQRFHKKHTAH